MSRPIGRRHFEWPGITAHKLGLRSSNAVHRGRAGGEIVRDVWFEEGLLELGYVVLDEKCSPLKAKFRLILGRCRGTIRA